MGKHYRFLSYMIRHKFFVLRVGLYLGVPLLQLVLHDLDKLHPFKWKAYAKS